MKKVQTYAKGHIKWMEQNQRIQVKGWCEDQEPQLSIHGGSDTHMQFHDQGERCNA